jgi:DNA-binding transcriptional regulator YiaG
MCPLRKLLADLLAVHLSCPGCDPETLHVDNVAIEEHAADVGFTGGEPGMSSREFRVLRSASLLTMQECARLLNVSLKTIWRWENAEARIDHFKAVAIRAVLVPGRGAKPGRMDTLADLDVRR